MYVFSVARKRGLHPFPAFGKRGLSPFPAWQRGQSPFRKGAKRVQPPLPWPFFAPTGRRIVAAGGATRPHSGPTRNPWKPGSLILFSPRRVEGCWRMSETSADAPRPQLPLTPLPRWGEGRDGPRRRASRRFRRPVGAVSFRPFLFACPPRRLTSATETDILGCVKTRRGRTPPPLGGVVTYGLGVAVFPGSCRLLS
jgi:hypothetical protein